MAVKLIDLAAGLTGSTPGDAGTVTYNGFSPEGDGLPISGSTATSSATANKTYTITISFSNAVYGNCICGNFVGNIYWNNTKYFSLRIPKTGKYCCNILRSILLDSNNNW